ncbi:MAG TPA: hypothetical protein VNO50_14795 [Pyrinomonadaceae bacterium]|nr:hypothetical protein [Pyrinomonadaceae bacterium]
MNEQTYNPELITQYLLGSLSEAESDRFDELSIADDRFAELLKAAENDLVDAFARGELTGTELAQFESHYLASSLRREKAEFADGFHEWSLAASNAQAEIEAKERAKDSSASWRFSVFGMRRPVWQWGLSFATLALLITGGLIVVQNMRAPRQIAQTEGGRDSSGKRTEQPEDDSSGQPPKSVDQDLVRERAERERLEQERRREQERLTEQERGTKEPPRGVIIAFILTPQMRNAGQVSELSIPPDKNRVVMHLQLEPNEFRAYRVYLLDSSGGITLWQSGTLRPKTTETTRTLEVGLRSAILKPQTYILRVKGVSAGGSVETVGDYPFKIAK